MSDENKHLEAVIAIFAELDAAPHPVDDVKGVADNLLPEEYTEVGIVRVVSDSERRYSYELTDEAYLITDRSVARSGWNVRNIRAKAAGIEGRTIVVDGVESTPIEFDSSVDIAPDDGWYSGLRTWSYRL